MTFGWSSRLLAAMIVGALTFAPLFSSGARSAEEVLTPAQKDAVQKVVHDYLIAHPEVVMEAVNALQAKEEQEKQEKQTAAVRAHKKDLFEQTDGTVIGNPKGNVTLVEFFDYNCGYCKSMFPSMMETLKADGKIRLILKEFPILGPSSVTASRAALAARNQGKYAELHLALLGHKGTLTDDTIYQIAKDTGLDIDKLKKDMADPALKTIINKNIELASDLDIEGTPALVVGDKLIPGALPKDKLGEIIKEARK